LNDHLDELRGQLAELKSDISVLQQEMNQLQARNATNNALLRDVENEINRLNEAIALLEKQVAQLQHQLSQIRDSTHTSGRWWWKKTTHINRQPERDAVSARIRTMESNISHHRSSVTRLYGEQSKIRDRIYQCSVEIDKNSNTQMSKSNKASHLETTTIPNKEQRLRTVKEKITVLNTALSQQEQERHSNEVRQETLEATADEKRDQINSLRGQIDKTDSDIRIYQDKINDTDRELDRTIGRLDITREELRTMTAAMNAMRMAQTQRSQHDYRRACNTEWNQQVRDNVSSIIRDTNNHSETISTLNRGEEDVQAQLNDHMEQTELNRNAARTAFESGHITVQMLAQHLGSEDNITREDQLPRTNTASSTR